MTEFSAEQSHPRPYFPLMRSQGDRPEMENMVHALDAIAATLSRIDLHLFQLISSQSQAAKTK